MEDKKDSPDWVQAMRRLCERDESIIKCCDTCKHGFWAGIADLRCTDPRKGYETAVSFGANALVCDNWEPEVKERAR